uniref:Uncharacterized protein n=1 Tax=Avena sativa TaxID=4498 RepID=A0ACD6A5I4_AVESA
MASEMKRGDSSKKLLQDSGQGTYHDSETYTEDIIGTQIPSSSDAYKYQLQSTSSDMFSNLHVETSSSNQRQQHESYQMLMSDSMNMSFTQMMLSVQAPVNQIYSSCNIEPMGSENKTFMITGRDGSSQTLLLDEDGEPEQQPKFGDNDEVEEDEQEQNDNYEQQPQFRDNDAVEDNDADRFYNWQWDDDNGQHNNESASKNTNNQESVINSDDNRDKYPATEIEMPEGVEQLTPEDIRLFLESESVKAACTGSQEAIGHHVPYMNMIFDTEEEAYKFYNEYASICGFSVRRASNYKGKNRGDEIGSRRTYTCHKFGKVVDPDVLENRKLKRQERDQARTGKAPADNTKKRRRNVTEVTGCKAKMVVSLKESKWHITNLELHHNHELCQPDESKFLRSHKNITNQEKLFIRTFTSMKLATRKIMAILTYLRGGKPKDVPYTKKDVSNVMTAIRQEDNSNDMMKVLEYFWQRKDEDPRYHYEFKLGKGNKVECIFWADGFSRQTYELYGDVVSFDTTFKTNKYNLPFALFVGVTGHGHNCLFGCAIINNEQGDTFKWLFQAFKRCHGEKHPLTIITDQDATMKNAIDAMLPHTCHRNCFFPCQKKG